MPVEASRAGITADDVWQAHDVDPAITAAVVDEAAKRASLIWVRGSGATTPGRPLWHAWIDGNAYVLTGGAEQPAPEGLAADGTLLEVTIMSKDNRSRLLDLIATATRVEPSTAEWDAVIPALRAKRLNLPDGDAAPARWAAESVVWRLQPTGDYADN